MKMKICSSIHLKKYLVDSKDSSVVTVMKQSGNQSQNLFSWPSKISVILNKLLDAV